VWGFLCFFPVAGLGYAIEQSNIAGKIIVILLFVGSIFAWSIMITKGRELGQAGRDSARFLSAYRKENHPVSLFLKRQRFAASPLYEVYDKACNALGVALEGGGGGNPDDLFMGGVSTGPQRLGKLEVSGVRNVAERTMADQALLLENRMGLVATAASTAPFLGLLGTVWGVMDSFAGMAVKGTAMLSAVAPGISGALLTTVVGLLVALPSAVGYNLLSDRIRRTCVELDNFVQELISDVERQYLRQD
jgi:biopolymer transport protein ExbB/TolQ